MTDQQIEDRMHMYEEAASHLELEVCETESERLQAHIVALEIRQLASKFYKKVKPQ